MRQANLYYRAACLSLLSLSACYRSTRVGSDEPPDGGEDQSSCGRYLTLAEGISVPEVVVEGETVEIWFSHHRPGTDDYCATAQDVSVTVVGDRIDIDLGCSCADLGPSRVRDRVVLPALSPGEYIIVMGEAELRLVVLPASDCEALRLSAESLGGVEYAPEVSEDEPVRFAFRTAGSECCGKTWSVEERRQGNAIELTVTERACESQCCCGCDGQSLITHDIYGLAPGDYRAIIGAGSYPFTVSADLCEIVPSRPVSLELTANQVCALDLLDVIVDHEVDGCGCNIEVGLQWEQRGYTLDVTTEVQYCPTRCYDAVCTDRFRSRGMLRFVTPGIYEVRAGEHRSSVEVLDCSG